MFKPLYNPTQLTCQITIGDYPPCEGVQKLIGFAKGLAFHRVDYFPYWHHSNNIRLGYNRDSWSSPIRLFMYAYVDGKLIDPKECVIGEFEVGEKIRPKLYWMKSLCAIEIYKTSYPTHDIVKLFKPMRTLPIGYLLNPYAEQDYTGVKLPLEVEIKDLKINGKMIKL